MPLTRPQQRGRASVELIVPAGVYETGPLTLYSVLILTREAVGIICFRADPHCYPPIWTRWDGIKCYAMQPLIYASEASNITWRVEGVIDDAGQWWRNTFRQIEAEDRMTPWESYELALDARNPDYLSRTGVGVQPQTLCLRPPLLQFWKCRHIRLEESPYKIRHFDLPYGVFAGYHFAGRQNS